MKYLSEDDETQFKEALAYMHVDELKLQLEQLGLSSKGFNKNELIQRLVHYALTGKELPPAEIPAISRASKGISNVLDPKVF